MRILILANYLGLNVQITGLNTHIRFRLEGETFSEWFRDREFELIKNDKTEDK